VGGWDDFFKSGSPTFISGQRQVLNTSFDVCSDVVPCNHTTHWLNSDQGGLAASTAEVVPNDIVLITPSLDT